MSTKTFEKNLAKYANCVNYVREKRAELLLRLLTLEEKTRLDNSIASMTSIIENAHEEVPEMKRTPIEKNKKGKFRKVWNIKNKNKLHNARRRRDAVLEKIQTWVADDFSMDPTVLKVKIAELEAAYKDCYQESKALKEELSHDPRSEEELQQVLQDNFHKAAYEQQLKKISSKILLQLQADLEPSHTVVYYDKNRDPRLRYQ
jgi:hypothetical protein